MTDTTTTIDANGLTAFDTDPETPAAPTDATPDTAAPVVADPTPDTTTDVATDPVSATVAASNAAVDAASTTPTVTPSATDDTRDLVSVPGVGEVDLVTEDKTTKPKLVQEADGTYHLIIGISKATKAHISAAVAGVLGAADAASTYLLPAGSEYTHWLQIGMGVVATAAAWFGVYNATNAPKN
jgi:hypothetical protein